MITTEQIISLLPGGRLALLGTTVSPGFEFADDETGQTNLLMKTYPQDQDLIFSPTKQSPLPLFSKGGPGVFENVLNINY